MAIIEPGGPDDLVGVPIVTKTARQLANQLMHKNAKEVTRIAAGKIELPGDLPLLFQMALLTTLVSVAEPEPNNPRNAGESDGDR